MFTAKDFFKPCKYNPETQNQIWMSMIQDSHDNHCSCNKPFAHLLASIFPPGHKDRGQTIEYIINRDYNTKCHFGGQEETNSGLEIGTDAAAGLPSEIKEEHTEEENLDDLLAAAAAAAEDELR